MEKLYAFSRQTVIPLLALSALVLALHGQTSRPVTDQVTCTGTAAPGSLFGFIAIAPAGTAAAVPLGPFRCVALDPNVFKLDATGQLTIKVPAAPIAGIPCAPPGADQDYAVKVYALNADKASCLELVAVANPSVFQNFQGAWQYLFVKVPPFTILPMDAR